MKGLVLVMVAVALVGAAEANATVYYDPPSHDVIEGREIAAGSHWAGKGERTIKIADCVSHLWDRKLRRAASEWSKSRYIRMPVVRCGTKAQVVAYSIRSTVWWDGLADVEGSNHIITHATIKLNSFRRYRVTLGLACHELGHTLGQQHNYRLSSCMKSVPWSNFPDGRDYATIRQNYK